jgi:hypothetical protein
LWLIGLLLLAAIGLGVYAYFTTPLPLGLGTVIRTPGGVAAAGESASPLATGATTGGRTPAGHNLMLGAVTVAVQTVQRNVDLSSGGRGGPPGAFTLVDIVIQNSGSQPITPQASDFLLVDDQGRAYAVDMEATRTANTASRHRTIFDASVPPTGSLETELAFPASQEASGLSLRVMLGYGEVELPR